MTATSQPDTTQSSSQETQTGLDENVAGTLAYVLGWISGIIMYLVESDNETVRFHAAQSIVVFGGLFVVSLLVGMIQSALTLSSAGAGGNVVFGLLTTIFGLISTIIWIAGLVLWIYLLVRTYQGENPRIPFAASLADSIA